MSHPSCSRWQRLLPLKLGRNRRGIQPVAFLLLLGLLAMSLGCREARPVAVSDGLPFREVPAGVDHPCGVTTGSKAYCWGSNMFGQLGDGTTDDSSTPVPVADPT